jgi:uncharacterized protein YqjF (DUF2071 family)
MPEKNIFLTAEWRKLILINYVVDKDLLLKYLPPFTELDDFEGKYYVSIVGFMFTNTKLLGLKIPFHGKFEEVNLRFYVKYNENGVWKRGAVFISEIVPKPMITLVANTIYQEKYSTAAMKHNWFEENNQFSIEYAWKNKKWNKFSVIADNKSEEMKSGSEEEFIAEHYWGYTKINDQTTSEYEVGHPKWQIYPIKSYHIEIDFLENYGPDFAHLKNEKPNSVILAEGSDIFVKKGKKLKY